MPKITTPSRLGTRTRQPEPFFTVITPTLQRESLIETCRSLDDQVFTDWEHFVIVDQEEFNLPLLDRIEHPPRRRIGKCATPHRDAGNSCRHSVWPVASGAWVYYLDDDNYLADPLIFSAMHAVLSPLPEIVKWALFPIFRLGHIFYCDPPRSCHVDTLNFILRREVAEWPQTDAYGADGVLIDRLITEKVSYAAFPDFRPIAVLPKISFGQ